MHDSQPHPITLLPAEVVAQIFSVLPKEMLLCLRLVNRHFETVSTPLAFRSLRLEAHGEFPTRFIQISKSEKLRRLVQELTCDTWVGCDFVYRVGDGYEIPWDFLRALPYLRYLSHLQALHLRFNPDCGFSGANADDAESYALRERVLVPVFRCLAGTWSVDEQKEFDQEWELEVEYPEEECQYHRQTRVDSISLTTLTVSNLAAYSMDPLTESEAFKSVMASPTLVDIKIYVTVETEGMDRDHVLTGPDRLEFYDNLHATWLSPPVAVNLRELSLYCHENWGWFPKLDFRTLGAGKGLPNLKVLALGKFVFSHEWQIDWVASLGLEELYLDNCSVLAQIKIRGALDDTTQTVGQDASSHDICISNAGYLPRNWYGSKGGNLSIARLPLRWHVIFNNWRKSMTTLRVFKVGTGAWEGAPEETILANFLLLGEYKQPWHHYLEPRWPCSHQFKHNAFRYFRCPPPGGSGDGYRHGTGMGDSTNLGYVQFNVYEWGKWKDERDEMMSSDDPKWIPEHDVDAKDQEELNLLVCKMKSQQSQSSVGKQRPNCGNKMLNWE